MKIEVSSGKPKPRTINSIKMIDRVMKWQPDGTAAGVKPGYDVKVWHTINGWFASVTRPPRIPGGPPHIIYNDGMSRDELKRWATEKYIECIREDANGQVINPRRFASQEDLDNVMSTVNPCPKCGGKPERDDCGPERQAIVCWGCGSYSEYLIEIGTLAMLIEAIRRWNDGKIDGVME